MLKAISKKLAFSMNATSPIQPPKAKGVWNVAAHLFVYLYLPHCPPS